MTSSLGAMFLHTEMIEYVLLQNCLMGHHYSLVAEKSSQLLSLKTNLRFDFKELFVLGSLSVPHKISFMKKIAGSCRNKPFPLNWLSCWMYVVALLAVIFQFKCNSLKCKLIKPLQTYVYMTVVPESYS